jgi:hypothetical protein
MARHARQPHALEPVAPATADVLYAAEVLLRRMAAEDGVSDVDDLVADYALYVAWCERDERVPFLSPDELAMFMYGWGIAKGLPLE